MTHNRGPLSSDDIENFIWFHLCKAYNEDGKEAVDFEELFVEGDESVPTRDEINEAADYLAEQGHVEKRVGEGELCIELTNFGKKKCEGVDIGTTWSV
ncbi:hypothetical protein KGY71_04200 [Candidatus Bipolaricaulota bacterium]|nr:hypothetical protein [Candidatus Bipolaricaulota bacterium]